MVFRILFGERFGPMQKSANERSIPYGLSRKESQNLFVLDVLKVGVRFLIPGLSVGL